jgi:hypothetical protein
MHPSTYEYLQPTVEQQVMMRQMRIASADFGAALEDLLPEGPDKTYIIRRHRETAMWCNVAITRNADGSPRG